MTEITIGPHGPGRGSPAPQYRRAGRYIGPNRGPRLRV